MAYSSHAKQRSYAIGVASASGLVASYASGNSATTWPITTQFDGATVSSRGSSRGLARQVVVAMATLSATSTASACASIRVSGLMLDGESTTFSTVVNGSVTTRPIGPFLATVSNILVKTATVSAAVGAAQDPISLGWGTAVQTKWYPVDWHPGGVHRLAIYQVSGSHNTHIHHTYSDLLGGASGSIIAFGEAVGTVSGTEQATTFNFPFTGYRLQTEATGTLDTWLYSTQIKSN